MEKEMSTRTERKYAKMKQPRYFNASSLPWSVPSFIRRFFFASCLIFSFSESHKSHRSFWERICRSRFDDCSQKWSLQASSTFPSHHHFTPSSHEEERKRRKWNFQMILCLPLCRWVARRGRRRERVREKMPEVKRWRVSLTKCVCLPADYGSNIRSTVDDAFSSPTPAPRLSSYDISALHRLYTDWLYVCV